MKTLPTHEVRARVESLLASEGVTNENVQLLVDHYLGNEVIDKPSHGLFRVPKVVEHLRDEGPGGVLHSTVTDGSQLVLDAQRLPGVVALHRAADLLSVEVKKAGIASVGVSNYQFGSGVLGRYTWQLAQQGLVGVAMANSYPLVAPPGGRDPVIGTNPISIAVPTTDKPLVVDVSTAATAWGKLANATEVPEGLVIDADGNPSTDAADADRGAMLALGDHKGFGLALMVELLAGPFIGADAGMGTSGRPRNDGAFLLAWRPSSEAATEQAKAFARSIERGNTRPGSDGIRLPGSAYRRLGPPIEWPEVIYVEDAVHEAFMAL